MRKRSKSVKVKTKKMSRVASRPKTVRSWLDQVDLDSVPMMAASDDPLICCTKTEIMESVIDAYWDAMGNFCQDKCKAILDMIENFEMPSPWRWRWCLACMTAATGTAALLAAWESGNRLAYNCCGGGDCPNCEGA